MTRLLIHVEGQTEEDFVNRVLDPYLRSIGYEEVTARLLGTSNSPYRSNQGGMRPWDSVRKDVIRHLKDDPKQISSTMVDYYGMHQTWPGYAEARLGQKTISEQADMIEKALLKDIAHAPLANPERFVPYVVMHEFEGLLFSDPVLFAQSIERPDLTCEFQNIRDGFQTPEEIDDSPQTAPSKRIELFARNYQKPLMGVQAVQAIGLDTIRRECPLFDGWIKRLEGLA